MPLNKPLDQVTEADLQALKDDKVAEGKVIDYKRDLPGNSDESKKEFRADVSSFANAAGGHLIFGIDEDAGVPVDVCGFASTDIDKERQRLENMLRDGVQPRIPGVALHGVLLEDGKWCLVIRIPKSWAQPHAVGPAKSLSFYSRNSAGSKYPLDVPELRAAFVLSESTAERTRSFRTQRLSAIIAGETPVPMDESSKIVFHLIPFDAFDPATFRDTASLTANLPTLDDFYEEWGNFSRYNFDGLLFPSTLRQIQQPDSITDQYVQVFRNGIIEAVDGEELSSNNKVISGYGLELRFFGLLSGLLLAQSTLSVEPPVFLMVSFLGMRGYTIATESMRFSNAAIAPIDRDHLLMPEVLIESFQSELGPILRPMFDALWNASGYARSPSYKQGVWTPLPTRRR